MNPFGFDKAMLRAILSRDSTGNPILTREELHHLLRVRRLQPAEEFLALEPVEQKWFRCRLLQDRGPGVEVLGEEPSRGESPLEITLAQSLIQRDRFEWVIQKSVELGVSRIIPIQTRRTEFRLPPGRSEKLSGRWEKIAREAVKQCGRSRVPAVEPVHSLEAYLAASCAGPSLCLDECGSDPLAAILPTWDPVPTRCSILIGPEGGWDPAERGRIQAGGFQTVSLGTRILRAETAAVVALALLQYSFGDLSFGRAH